MEWSIQQIAKIAGTTSRTLRHYGELGLVSPSRIGDNGYRYYDRASLVRLQRVLLLRQLGLGLPQIAEVLEREADEATALATHLQVLVQEKVRLDRQIAAVERTINALKGGQDLMAEDMFDGFDHTQYRQEVEERWGKRAYAESDRWWRELGADGQKQWLARLQELNRDWTAAWQSGMAPDSAEAHRLAGRHIDWLRGVPGVPQEGFEGYVKGLVDMYVEDPRFVDNYGGQEGAKFVRAAIRSWLAV